MKKGLEKCFQIVYEYIRVCMVAGFIWFLYDFSKIISFILGILSIISFILKLIHIINSFLRSKNKCQNLRKEIDDLVDASLDEQNNQNDTYKKEIKNRRFKLDTYKRKKKKNLFNLYKELAKPIVVASLMLILFLFGNNIKKIIVSNIDNAATKKQETNDAININRKMDILEKNEEDKLENTGLPNQDPQNVPDLTFYLPEDINTKYPDQIKLDKVFYAGRSADIDQEVVEHYTPILAQNKEDTFSKEANVLDKEAIDEASQEENVFFNNQDSAKRYIEEGNMEDWQTCIGSFKDLDFIMETRIKIINAGKGNENICFLLANDYQAYADECKRQRVDENVQLRFYIECIILAEEALSYESSPDVKKMIYNYISGRYKDIMNLKDIESDYREQAEKIYNSMQYIVGKLAF